MIVYAVTAWRSCQALATAFGSSVLPRHVQLWYYLASTTTTTTTATRHAPSSDGVCLLKDGSAKFFLDFKAAAAASPNSSSSCAGTDWFILVFLFLVVHTISWSIRWTVWEPFYRWHRGNDGTGGTSKKDMENFSQSLTAALFCVLSAYFAYRILSTKDWLYDQKEWFQFSDSLGADFKFYYMLYAARNMSDLLSLYFEHNRSGALSFAIHHITTIVLLLVSAHAGYTKAGGLLTFFFDWADPFLLVAKAFKYLSRNEADVYQFVTNRLFEVFAVIFLLTRNILFTYIVYCAWTEEMKPLVDGSDIANARLFLNSMLVLLDLVMTYWLGLIVQGAIHQFRHGNVEDIREIEVIQKEKLRNEKIKSA
jgi:hypothetical protein